MRQKALILLAQREVIGLQSAIRNLLARSVRQAMAAWSDTCLLKPKGVNK